MCDESYYDFVRRTAGEELREAEEQKECLFKLKNSVSQATSVEEIFDAFNKAHFTDGLSEEQIASTLGVDISAFRQFCLSVRFDKETYLFELLNLVKQ